MSSNAAGEGSVAIKKESKKPKYTKFTQQELPACKPLLTPTWVIGTFLAIAVVEIVKRYEDLCLPNLSNAQRQTYIQDNTTPKNCSVTLTVPKKMKPPIYVYYELTNFYQNHRRYVKSRNDEQLRNSSTSDLSSCKPQDYLNGSRALPINPCGLIAWSNFNDSYAFSVNSGIAMPVDERGISWKSDREKKFGSQTPKNFNTIPALRGGGTLNESKPLDEDEHLIVWMRTAALPTFRKLWGKIGQTLNKGDTVIVNIQNQYNTYAFNGKKKLILSTSSWLGGKNNFLGVAYITVGCTSLALALLFLALHLKNPRPLGDTSYLSWNRKGHAPGSVPAN
eukprot:jgi/Mesen1/2618/ME000166S01733